MNDFIQNNKTEIWYIIFKISVKGDTEITVKCQLLLKIKHCIFTNLQYSLNFKFKHMKYKFDSLDCFDISKCKYIQQ